MEATLATKANIKGAMMEEAKARNGRASRKDGINQLFMFQNGKCVEGLTGELDVSSRLLPTF